MSALPHKFAVLLLPGLILALGSDARGQGRNFSSPGTLRGVGNSSFGHRQFLDNSYGLGAMDRGGPSTGVLNNQFSTLLRPQGGASGGAGSTPLESLQNSSRVLYRPGQLQLRPMGGPGFVAAYNRPKDQRKALQSSGIRMQDVFGIPEAAPLAADTPLTSFVPETTGRYAQLMAEGEQAMRQARYDTAVETFTQASYISGRTPETLLSLAHANYAKGQYSLMAHYVRLAISYFPELPLANIQLRAFFRDSAEFVRAREELLGRAHIMQEADLWLALAYVQWFDGVPDEAADALRRAAQLSADPVQTEAIRSFWDACVADGRIVGSLATQPMPSGAASGAFSAGNSN